MCNLNTPGKILNERVRRTVRRSADDIGWLLQRAPDMPPVEDRTDLLIFLKFLGARMAVYMTSPACIKHGVKFRLPRHDVHMLPLTTLVNKDIQVENYLTHQALRVPLRMESTPGYR
nr:hypothetical protein [Tanacetum cinerariifolium]